MGNGLDIVVKNEINNAPKTQNGAITRKEAIKVLQNIFKKDNGTVTKSKSKAERREYNGQVHPANGSFPGCGFDNVTGYGYGYGYGYGGFLSQTKDLFELYMDKDSEGGENITVNEQKSIIVTVQNWMKNL